MIRTILIFTLAAVVRAQTPAAPAPAKGQPPFTSKLLIQEPLGETTDPMLSLYVLTLGPGASAPAHSHRGAVFAYVLEGDIENQVEPEPAAILHPGGVFHERPMQMHRVFRNLSKTEPAKILIFQNTSHVPDGVKLLRQEPLANLRNQEVTLATTLSPPGMVLPGAHEHPGPVFAYLVRGLVESQVDPDPPKTYRAGEVFYEPPMHAHRMYRNLSTTEDAELLLFGVGEKGAPRVLQLGQQGSAAIASRPVVNPPSTPQGMLPYTAILDPQYIPAAQASFLEDGDILLGVASGNVAKAFPAADMAQHGSVNDVMPDGPIEATWCGTCNTGVVFKAQFKGRLLHFDYDSMVGANEVHKDRETGSRWQQSTGEAISGPLKGGVLDLYPFVRTTWKEWRTRYPNTLVLKPMPGYDERMPNLSKRMKAVTLSGEGDAPKGAFGNDGRLRPKEVVAGLRIGTEEEAFPFSQLRIAKVVNERVGGVPVVVVHQPSSDTTTAFEGRAKGRVLRFQATDADAKSLVDEQTHSRWNAYGLCVDGPLKGTQLKRLILVGEFWFAWSEFHPKTRVFLASNAAAPAGTFSH